jgi:hypothetical protein
MQRSACEADDFAHQLPVPLLFLTHPKGRKHAAAAGSRPLAAPHLAQVCQQLQAVVAHFGARLRLVRPLG